MFHVNLQSLSTVKRERETDIKTTATSSIKLSSYRQFASSKNNNNKVIVKKRAEEEEKDFFPFHETNGELKYEEYNKDDDDEDEKTTKVFGLFSQAPLDVKYVKKLI